MSYAPDYTPGTSFADDEANNVAGRSMVKTDSLDAELADISTSINDVNNNLQALQRDDNKLKDGIIEPYALSEQTNALIATAGCNPRGTWAPNTDYAFKDIVQRSNIAQICLQPHNSGSTFTQSLWLPISGDGTSAANAAAAAASASAASAAELSASLSAATATGAASAAAASANSAATSATNASNSASSASTSSTNASNSATEAQTSATNAASSATTAQNAIAAIQGGTYRVTSPTGSLGYANGAGGAVTQSTSKTTSVTLNRPTGQVTMNAASLAPGAAATFVLNNSTLGLYDTFSVGVGGGSSTPDAYAVRWRMGGGGAVVITVTNTSGSTLSEAVILNFAVIKGSNS